MDRGRESRRGGGGGGGGGAGAISGHAASRRRPRSGFKDSAACEEEEGLNESLDSTKLRERSSSNIINNGNNNNKKERSSLLSSRNKRRRPGLPERFHGGGRDRDNDEVDESSEGSPVEDEEEDDDEPPHRPLPNPRRTTKFKSQWKVSEEMIGAGLVSVPRKARSASVKRPHDSTSSAVLLTSVAVSDGCAHRRQKSPSPARPSVVPASPSSSNASVKPGRRMKPIGTKPRPSKMAKVSNSISEREVEVAEVLFGLTRQIHKHHPAVESYTYANASKHDAKDYSNDGSAPPTIYKVSSPLPTSSVVSSPISTSISPPPSSPAVTLPYHSASAPTPPTAPKKKRPRPVKPEEASLASAMRPPVSVSASATMPCIASGARNDTESTCQAAKTEISFLKSEPEGVFSAGIPKGIPSVATSESSISAFPNQVSTPPMPPNQTDVSIASEKITATNYADLISITSEKTADAKISDLKMTTEKIVDGHSPDLKTFPSNKAGGVNSADMKCVTNEYTLGTKEAHPAEKNQFDAPEDLNKLAPDVSEAQSDQIAKEEIDSHDTDLFSRPDKNMENANMLSQLPKTESFVEEKFQIDLMAPPEKSSLDTDDDSVPVAVGNAAPEVLEEGTGEITDISEFKAVTVKEESQSDKTKEELKAEEAQKKYDKRDEGGEKILQKEHIKEQRGIDLQLDEEKLDNISSKPLPQNQSRAVRNESRTEKAEKPEAAVTANVGGSSSAVASMPIPMTVAGWPGALPLGRYFAPAAANWPGAPSLPGVVALEGPNTTQAIQPPYILPKSRQTWKRCATHSYIAHFIECQLRMTPHPFWTAANYFGSRQYNLNAPLPPSSEIINLGSSISGTVSPASAGNSVSVSRGLESMQDQGIGSTPLSYKEKNFNYMDVRRKQPLHQQATQQISSTIMQPGHAFTLSTTQSGAVGGNSSTAGSTGNVGSLVNGGNVAVGALPSCGTGPGNGNLASIGADAQYMAMLQQSGMLQQGGYPFAINPHFGATYSGASNHCGQQQAAQFFNTPFYATQLLPPQPQHQPQSQQQGPQNPSTSSGSSSSQQHKQQLQGSRNFSSSQKQQQQGTSSPSPSNSQQQHHMPMTQARHIDREANNEGDSPSTADSRLPALQKTFYSPGSPSSSNFSVTPPSLLPPGLPVQAQDLALFPALGGKHNGKQQQPTPPQIQHQVAAGYNLQPHHGNDQTFQMSLKGLELSQSQAQAIAVSNRNPGVLCFPHIAQSHAMLQSIAESSRHQMAVQAHQNAVQPGTQPQHSGQMQRTQITSTGDGRNSIDSTSNAGARGRDEERKLSMKGGIGHSLNFSRIETETSTNMQGSPTDGSLTNSLVAHSISPAVNGSRNSRPTSSSSQGSPHLPSTQQLNQITKQTASRAKTVPSSNASPSVASAQIPLSNYGDRTAVPSNLNKIPAPLSYPSQNLKQGQQSPQWKISPRTVMPSIIPTAGSASSQTMLAAEMKSLAQQGRNQHSNTNTGASGVCSPQASFVTSTKNSGQMPMNQKNNATSIAAPKLPTSNVASVVGSFPISSSPPVSKSVGSPASRSPTGSKGPVSQQKSAAATSNKKSSPVGSRSMPSVLGPSNVSQSTSGKSGQQQYQQQQQSMPAMASVQPVGLKNQQYHNQAHFNQQQLIFSHPQYLQQHAVQQSQFSAQTAHQMTGFHQKQQVHGSNSPQPSFSSAHLRQQVQQQQMQLTSSTSSSPGTLSLGPPPTLTLGGTSVVPVKTNPGGSLGGNSKGNTILHTQCSGQQQLGNPLVSPYMQAVTNVSSKSADQRVVADVLSQEQINGVRMPQNSANLCTSLVQNRSPFNTSSPQAASVRVPPGSLRKSEGVNTVESLNNPGGISLSMAPSLGIRTNSGLTGSANAGQNAKATAVSSAAVHSNQISPMSIHQPPVPLAGGAAPGASPGLHGQTAASAVQP